MESREAGLTRLSIHNLYSLPFSPMIEDTLFQLNEWLSLQSKIIRETLSFKKKKKSASCPNQYV